MTMTTNTKNMIAALLALAVAGCDNKPAAESDKAGKTDGKDPKANRPAPQAAAGDPEKGEFTLEEATAGLAGAGKLMAKFTTAKGDIVCELLPDVAPVTVANFVGLARGLRPWLEKSSGQWVKKPFYDGTAFHRVIPGFMIQGGDQLSRTYSTSPEIGSGDPGFKVVGEFQDKILYDKPGRLAMARSQDPDSAGSQFFITDGAKASLNNKYTIFGNCENVDVVHAIATVPAGPPPPENARPVEAVTMTVEIFRR